MNSTGWSVRRAGGGREKLTERNAILLIDLRNIIEPITHGNPGRALRWVSKSREKLAVALRAMGRTISSQTVGRLPHALEYRRRGNAKAVEGKQNPGRDAQFEYINKRVLALQAGDQPVISVDTKKKELIGSFRNPGTDYCPEGKPRRVNAHDFPDPELGEAIPYGVYDVTDNSGWVSAGVTRGTASFAVNTIRCWLKKMGRARYPGAGRLPINVGCGGSNGARVRLWRVELQKFADETGLILEVCHYPPAPRSGTRSSTGCSATFRRTGVPSRSSAVRRSSG